MERERHPLGGDRVLERAKGPPTREDVIARAGEVLRWQVANGVLHVRSHVDVTDASFVALDALVELRDMVRDVVDLQLVAFPQEGIESFPNGEGLMEESVRRRVDIIGAIPHFEDTQEDGVRSLEFAVALADRHGLLVDAHCDEIDDEQSRFVEVLATQAMRSGLRERVTASHTTAMGSYGPAYSFKLQRILSRAGINLVSNPLINLHLQGRFDGYPKRGADPGERDAERRGERGLRSRRHHGSVVSARHRQSRADRARRRPRHATHLTWRGGGVLPDGDPSSGRRARRYRSLRRRGR